MPQDTILQNCIIAHYSKSSRFLIYANVLRWLSFLATIASFFILDSPSWFPLALIIICLPIEVFIWRGDVFKQQAEKLKRIHEFSDGLGVEPSAIVRANAAATLAGNLSASPESLSGLVFASNEFPSAKRAIENLRESSWFSQQLAQRHAWQSLFHALSLIAVAALIPIALPHFVSDAQQLVTGSLVSSSIVLGLFSLGIARRVIGLWQFSNAAGEAAADAHRILSQCTEFGDSDALLLLNQYQIDRAGSPSISSRLWVKYHERLDKLFKEHFTL